MKILNLPQIPGENSEREAVNAGKKNFLEMEIRFGPLIPLREKQRLYHLLATLLRSGLGMLDCLDILSDQTRQREIRDLVVQIRENLAEGVSFSECLASRQEAFTSFEVHSLRMGEQTGRMTDILLHLAMYFERKIGMRRKVIQSLSYPFAVVMASLLVLAFMLGFVVPMFQDIFARFDAELPAVTQGVIQVAAFFKTYGIILLAITGSISGVLFWLRKRPWLRQVFSGLILKMPFFGKLSQKIHLARFARTLSMLLLAKVQLERALVLISEMTGFYPLEKALCAIHISVVEGNTLHEAMGEHSFFPSFFLQMIRVGEQAASLDVMTEQMAQNLEEESEALIQQLTQFIEPLLIVFLGAMVAVILIAMYLPMFELGNAMG